MLAGRIDASEEGRGGRKKEGGVRGRRMKMYFWGCVGEGWVSGWVGSVGGVGRGRLPSSSLPLL